MVRKVEEDDLKNMFKPQIGRGPTDNHKLASQTVHEHLYNYKDIYKTKGDLNREMQYKGEKNRASAKMTNNSDSILESSLYEKFTKLFNLIDTDENG